MSVAKVIHDHMSIHLLYAYILEREGERGLKTTNLGLDTECRCNSNIAILKVLVDVCTQTRNDYLGFWCGFRVHSFMNGISCFVDFVP